MLQPARHCSRSRFPSPSFPDPFRFHADRQTIGLRPFTQNYKLLISPRSVTRPQLPFLHLTSHRPHLRNRFQAQIARLLTTETRRGLKEIARTAVKGTIYFWLIVGLGFIVKFGIDNEVLERTHPTPPSWSFLSRIRLRFALGEEDKEQDGTGLVDWAKAGDAYRRLISRLEDPAIDGSGLRPPLGEGEDIYVEGIGKTGLDISKQPESWRRGYYQALMGAARAAEHLDTWVRDVKRNLAFPSEVVVGGSNPRPKPIPYGAAEAPKEKDCEPAFEQPQVYYMKILTTQGFTGRQRLDAALAYADWLRFKGLRDAAAEMHSWALDIAVSGLPASAPAPASQFVDRSTGIISADFPAVSATPNFLIAATAFATHHARVGDLSIALPAFLSILRTYQSLPLPSVAPNSDVDGAPPQPAVLDSVKNLFTPPPYPPEPPSGNEPAVRTPANICATAAIMSHIGEILYAADLDAKSSPSPNLSSSNSHDAASFFTGSFVSDGSWQVGPTASQAAGLAWTRQAVNLAEETLRALDQDSGDNPIGSGLQKPVERAIDEKLLGGERPRTRCAECLEVAMENWVKMVERLETAQRIAMRRKEKESRRHQQQQQQQHDQHVNNTTLSKRWFWGAGTNDHKQPPAAPAAQQQRNKEAQAHEGEGESEEGVWEIEARKVRARAREVRRLLRQEGAAAKRKD